LKYKFGYDDSLDVVGVHLVAGLWGTLALGLLATDGRGLFYGGDFSQLAVQAIIVAVAIAISAVVTLVLGLAIKFTIGWRVSDEAEERSIDLAEHGEAAYESIGARVQSEVK